MIRLQTSLLFGTALCSCSALNAQTTPDPESTKPHQSAERSFLDDMTPYGSLRLRLAYFDGESEVQNGSSRIGLAYKKTLGDDFDLIGQVELQLNLAENNTDFKVGDSTNSEITIEDQQDAVATRLGYLGLDWGDRGRLTIGKQWGVYSDVSIWTDLFHSFGGAALGTYTSRTDGGLTGVGRAEQAVAYRVGAGCFTLGAQVQLSGDDDQVEESGGVSLLWKPAEALTFGVAYNRATLTSQFRQRASLTGKNASALVVGFNYDDGPLYLAAAYAVQQDHEVAFLPNDKLVGFDSWGIELYGRYSLTETYRAVAGFNLHEPTDLAPTIDKRFGVRDFIAGVDYMFTPRALAFLEGRVALGADELGVDDDHSITVGMRVDF